MMGSAIAAAVVVPQIYAQHLAQKFYASRMETSINTGIADMQMGLPSCSTHKCSYCGRERHKAGHVSCDGCGASQWVNRLVDPPAYVGTSSMFSGNLYGSHKMM